MHELIPCRHCGSTDVRIERSERVTRNSDNRVIKISTRYRCFCPECLCGTGFRLHEQDARAAWNRMAEEENKT